MTGLVFNVDTTEVDALIEGVVDVLTLPNGLGEAIADVMRQDAQRQFSVAGEPAWKPLHPRTVARKRKLGYPRLSRDGSIPKNMVQNGGFGPQNILMETGALLTSWTRADDPDHYEKVDDFAVEIGSTIDYAEAHQQGRPETNLPKRAITLSDVGREAIAKLITKTIGEEINK